MKVRKGFVSNSSSSSFICDVCGQVESGMDASLSDFEMVECKHGHTICEAHLPSDWRAQLTEEEDEDFEGGDRFLPDRLCPICTLKSITDHDMVKFLLKKAGMARVTAAKQITEEFADLVALREYLKEIE